MIRQTNIQINRLGRYPNKNYWPLITIFFSISSRFYTPVPILTGRIIVYTRLTVRPSIRPFLHLSVIRSVRPSSYPSIFLSSVNMSHRNLRTAYLVFMKLNKVISWNGQTICKPFSENQIKSFWVTELCK